MTNDIDLVKLSLKNPAINNELTGIIRRYNGFEILSSGDNRKPDILIFELTENADRDISFIQSLIFEKAVDDVFLTSEISDSKILLKALRIGVREFLPQPIDIEEFKNALQRRKTRKKENNSNIPDKKGRVITAFGSKGGVGTTTVSVNLAVALAMKKSAFNVCLVDMNTLFGEIPLFLEMTPKFHWGEITKNIERLDKTFLSNIMIKHNSGVSVLPSPAYLNGHLRLTPEIMSNVLELMKEIYDYIIIDGGQVTDDTTLKIVEMSDALLLITILSLPCLANTSKIITSFEQLGYTTKDQIKIIVNRYMKKSEILPKDAQKGIGKELFWTIPNDYQTTMSAINQGKPLLNLAPKSIISQCYKEFANALIAPQNSAVPKKKFRLF